MKRKAFYDTIRPTLGSLTTANVAGFERVLNEAERRKTPLGDCAYIIATGWWESGKTMAPVREAYYLGAKADGFRRKLRYYPYYGRGLVQLTHKDNYRKASDLVGTDLVANPDRALDPAISVQILFDGMEKGWFTGKSMSDYIDNIDEGDDEDLREYANARRVVNGTDRQVEIGKLALLFERGLRAAEYRGTVSPRPPKPRPADKPVAERRSPVTAIIGFLLAAGAAAFFAIAKAMGWM